MRLDTHHHFWHYNPAEYDWIDASMAAIRRDFLPEDLQREIAGAGVDAVISVQARQHLEETRWLLEMAGQHEFIHGIVGWVPLIDPAVEGILETFVNQRKLRGVRHVLQGEPDPRYMLRDDFNRGIAALRRFGLCYDLLIYGHQLPQAIELVDRHPAQVFILDHIAKPPIKAGQLEPWAGHIRDLARRSNVYCKLSGMITEADWTAWTPQTLQPFADTILEAFTPRRTMFGSDWPVCLVATTYADWVNTVQAWAAVLSPAEQMRLWWGTGCEAYGV